MGKKPGTKTELAAMIAKNIEQGCQAWLVEVQTPQGVLVRIYPLVLGEKSTPKVESGVALEAVERLDGVDAIAARIAQLGDEVRPAGLKIKVKPVRPEPPVLKGGRNEMVVPDKALVDPKYKD